MRRVPRRAAAAIAVAAAMAGCGGDDGGGGDVPEGWRTTERPQFTFATPDGWQIRTRPSQAVEGQDVTEASAPGTPAGVQVIVGATPGFGGGFDELVALNDADTRLRLPKRRQISQERLDVPGAKTARLTVLELPPGAPGGGEVPVRAFDLIALSEKGTAVNLFARAPASAVDQVRIDDVVASLRLRD